MREKRRVKKARSPMKNQVPKDLQLRLN